MNKAQIDRLRERVSAMCGPTLRVTLKDGSTRVISSANAVSLFKRGEATHAESNSGNNGMLCDLLNELNN